MSVTLYQFFDCFFNFIHKELDKPKKKESFLENDNFKNTFPLEQSIRFLMDNLDEQILWLEEKTLSDTKNSLVLERERLIVKIIVRMFQVLEERVGKLKELDTLCQKNLFSYVRLKNKTLTGKSKMIDSKTFPNCRPPQHDLHLLLDRKLQQVRTSHRLIRNDEQALDGPPLGEPHQVGLREGLRSPVGSAEDPVDGILDSRTINNSRCLPTSSRSWVHRAPNSTCFGR